MEDKKVICEKHDSTPGFDCFWCEPISAYQSIRENRSSKSESDNLSVSKELGNGSDYYMSDGNCKLRNSDIDGYFPWMRG